MARRPYTIIIASIFITSLCCIGIKDIRLVNKLRTIHVIIMVCNGAKKNMFVCWEFRVILIIDIFFFKGMKREATKCGYLQTVVSFQIKLGSTKISKELVNEGNH